MVGKGNVILKRKVIIGLNTAWNLYNFRSGLINSLIDRGYIVYAVAPPDDYVDKLKSIGCKFVGLTMQNKGINPFRDLLLFWNLLHIFREIKPDIFLGFTIKPNIYGSMVSYLSGVKYVNNVAGLGSVFVSQNFLQLFVKVLYQIAFVGSSKVFFQNNNDRQLFLKSKIVCKNKSDLLPGSGVNLKKFNFSPLPNKKILRFLLVARLIREKGIEFYVKAAELLKSEGLNAEFGLLGFLDFNSANEISENDILNWESQGSIFYLGETSDVTKELANADCVVLPSFYREGTPKVLLEASSMGRPIITTDSIGCRNVVDDGVNGFLCKPKDVVDLALKMKQMALLPPRARKLMGLRGREKMEREFNEDFVIQKYLKTIKSLLNT
jgi:glycosyltransferase involved in cell wall biosynthesis